MSVFPSHSFLFQWGDRPNTDKSPARESVRRNRQVDRFDPPLVNAWLYAVPTTATENNGGKRFVLRASASACLAWKRHERKDPLFCAFVRNGAV